MIERGLLSPRGRYVYVTPMLLAVWLAAEQLRAHDILKVIHYGQVVPDAERFWRRIGQMQGSISAERLASDILGASDRFRTMEDMNSEEASRLVFELAKVAPHAGAELLGRLTREVPLHELQSMTWGRRYQVWTLEHLAERADTFKLAASALLRLATAENESYGNNATGTFKGLFQTILGRTVVPAPDLQAAIHELASQAVADPGLLEDELRWLCGHEQVPNITEFGRALGEQDRHGSLTDKLIEATALNGDARLLANYAGGRSLAEMELETLLDLIEERAYGYLAQLLLLLPYRPSIKDRYMHLLADSPDALSTLDSTPVIWIAREMTDSEVVELLEPLIERSTAGSRWVALAILEERIQSGNNISFVETAWRVLEQHGDSAPHGTLVEHLWSEVAKEIASQDPTRMLGILLDHAEDAEDDPSQFTYSQQASVLLDVLAKAGPIDWETFIRRVTGEPRLRLSFSWWGQEKALLERVPLKTLQEWAGDSADRLEQIAMFAKPGDQLTPVIVWLIEQAGPVSDAARRLRMHMRSGVFSGSQENRERGFLTLFEKWAVNASSPALREWAEEGAEETRQWLPRIQQRENEYDWD